MKRILTSLLLVASVYSFAQVSISGEADDAPEATLDVKAIGGNTPDGILVPRVDRVRAKNMKNVKESTLIYVQSLGGSATEQAANIDAKGFYYYDTTSSKWMKLVSGSATDNLYSKDGNLEGDRVVTQNDHNLKFTTGTGALEIEGTSKLMGASYVNVTKLESGESYTAKANDYLISVDGPTSQFKVIVPNPEDAKGRVFIFTNKTANKLVLNLSDGKQAINTSQQSQIAAGKAEWIVSDGTKWYNLINF